MTDLNRPTKQQRALRRLEWSLKKWKY
jgi:hypothetical protein